MGFCHYYFIVVVFFCFFFFYFIINFFLKNWRKLKKCLLSNIMVVYQKHVTQRFDNSFFIHLPIIWKYDDFRVDGCLALVCSFQFYSTDLVYKICSWKIGISQFCSLQCVFSRKIPKWYTDNNKSVSAY